MISRCEEEPREVPCCACYMMQHEGKKSTQTGSWGIRWKICRILLKNVGYGKCSFFWASRSPKKKKESNFCPFHMASNWFLLFPWLLNSKIDMTIYDMFCMLCMLEIRLLKRNVLKPLNSHLSCWQVWCGWNFLRSPSMLFLSAAEFKQRKIEEALLTLFVWRSCSSCAIWQQCAWHQWLPFLCRDAAVRPPQKPQRRLLRWPWQRPWLWPWQRRWRPRPRWPLSRAEQQHWSADGNASTAPTQKRGL